MLPGLLLAAFVAVSVDIAPAGALTRQDVMRQAAEYAQSKGYHIGIAVMDTRTGQTYGSGDYRGTFASESVVKVFIATRLLVRGEMTGTTADMASRMIRRSDDAMANALYGRVGGDGLILWVKRHFDLPRLGSRPSRPGWWGNTHITPLGLVRLYAKIRHRDRLRPWLLHAMHHATPYGSDGTYQFFGLPSATSPFAIKQGWGMDYDDWSRSADFNTTGFVDNDRYAVAILARGPISNYGGRISAMLTHTARLLLPNGHFPDAVPTVSGLSRRAVPTRGGWWVTVHGSSFTQVTAVLFGSVAGLDVQVVSPWTVKVIAPAHAAGTVHLRVVTTHGRSPATTRDVFRFIAPPRVSAVSPNQGETAGGTRVTVTGASFLSVSAVRVGGVDAQSFQVSSPTTLTAVVPAHAAGTVDVRVITTYGRSAVVDADHFVYQDPQPTG